jgi:hypothetical protein
MDNPKTSYSDRLAQIQEYRSQTALTSIDHHKTVFNSMNVIGPLVKVLRDFIPEVEKEMAEQEARIASLESQIAKMLEPKPTAKGKKDD